jgi:hypothetical protein
LTEFEGILLAELKLNAAMFDLFEELDGLFTLSTLSCELLFEPCEAGDTSLKLFLLKGD